MSNEYFTRSLNYTLANEDTALELDILPKNVGHVLSVAGSGGRVLPLLARGPKRVTCVDVSQEQLYLTELRMESVRALTHSEFLAFWGYPPRAASEVERRELFEKIRLSTPAKEFLAGVFESQNWGSILYLGKWERTFGKLAKINRSLTGTRGLSLFNALTDQEHFSYLEKEFPKKAWAAVLMLLGNAGVFNALLYKGHFPKKNIKGSFYKFYEQSFDRLLKHGPARYSFFLQMIFFGKVVFAEGCPVECRLDVFEAAKKALSSSTEVQYRCGDLIEEAVTASQPIDFISLSDVPSYFKGETEKNFMQRISSNLNPGALAVLRNYLHVPENLDLSNYETVTAQYQAQIDREKVGVYLIEIYRRRS